MKQNEKLMKLLSIHTDLFERFVEAKDTLWGNLASIKLTALEDVIEKEIKKNGGISPADFGNKAFKKDKD